MYIQGSTKQLILYHIIIPFGNLKLNKYKLSTNIKSICNKFNFFSNFNSLIFFDKYFFFSFSFSVFSAEDLSSYNKNPSSSLIISTFLLFSILLFFNFICSMDLFQFKEKFFFWNKFWVIWQISKFGSGNFSKIFCY